MRAAVLGSPIAHSLSPVLHLAAYAHLGLDWSYDIVECDAAGLPRLLDGLGPDWAGLSLTMPLKAAVLPLLDETDAVAVQAAAANTVVLRDGRRLGSNTDVPGMAATLATALAAAGAAVPEQVSVLGAGATARSTLLSLAAAGARRVDVLARRPESVGPLVALGVDLGVGVRAHAWTRASELLAADLVVSTVPAGAADGLAGAVPSRRSGSAVLLDVVYAPWPTVLGTAWAAAGGTVVGGLELLLQQAALQVLLMTGRPDAPGAVAGLVAAMRGPGERALSHAGDGAR